MDNVIAAMEARHPHLTTQKSFYVEISRARDRAELVTNDALELRAQLQEATGERIAALEGIGEMQRAAPGKTVEAGRSAGKSSDAGSGSGAGRERAKGLWRRRRCPIRRSETAARRAWTLACEGNGAAASGARPRLAVLIEADNANAYFAQAVFKAAATLGEATVERIYGGFSIGRLASWNAATRAFAILGKSQSGADARSNGQWKGAAWEPARPASRTTE